LYRENILSLAVPACVSWDGPTLELAGKIDCKVPGVAAINAQGFPKYAYGTMPIFKVLGGAVLATGDPTLAFSGSQPDRAGTSALETNERKPYQIKRPDLQSERLVLASETHDVPPRSLEHVLTGLSDDACLPGWMRGIQGFRFICKASARFQELEIFRKAAEAGQTVAVEETNSPERDALFLQLALVAGPFGWNDEDPEDHEGKICVCAPLHIILQLLEGATTHLAAINWGWEHALARAAFLTFCIARILDDKRVSAFIEQLPPRDQELSLKLSKELVRNP
jgi:hypothetical protein